MEMTIENIMYLFIDGDIQEVILYDVESGNDLYKGRYGDIPENMKDYEVASIDNLNKTEIITFNVTTE